MRLENKKEIVFSPYLFPKVSIIDPEFQISVPSNITAKVGIDALIQGLEAFVSKNAQPFSDMFALEAIRHCITYLPKAIKYPENLESRSYVALAAIESMLAVIQAGVGAIHALSDPLSGKYNIHHGIALSILASKVMEINLDSNEQRFAIIAELFGVDITKISTEEASKESITCINSFLSQVNLYPSPKLREYGVNEQDLNLLVNDAKNPDMSTNPKELIDEEIMKIFKDLI